MWFIGCIIALQIAVVAVGCKHQRNKQRARAFVEFWRGEPLPAATVIQLNDYRKDAA